MEQVITTQEALDRFRKCLPLFQALGEAARQDIILVLGEHEALNVTQIAERSHLSRPAISHHLKILREVGLVTVEHKGKEHFYSLALEGALLDMRRMIEAAEVACT